MTVARRRLGIFGGAFDPPHLAHVALARVAIEQLALDALWVIPTGFAWHKTRSLSLAVHRVNMAKLAFAANPKVVIDERETRRAGPSYTIDTLLELKTENPLADLFLIIGEDQARSLPSWRHWQRVVQNAIICVAGRANSTEAKDGLGAEFLPPPAVSSRFLRLTLPLSPISATAIRAQVAKAEPIAALVGEPVARYIAQHHLYLQY